jgi:CRISPR-associated protein Cas1
MANRNLQEIPKFSDKLSFLYFEKGHIDQHLKSVAYHYLDKIVPIPVETVSLLMLGPGTTITHEAIKRIADSRCLLVWAGEQGVRFYSAGYAGSYKASNLLRQAVLFSDIIKRTDIVRRMYQKRFSESLAPDMTIEEIRGREGNRVRSVYKQMSQNYGVQWQGRNYDQSLWNKGDAINRAISSANSTLYGIVHAAILSAAFSPAIGFIHTGKQLSFVYDIADLYKTEITIPIAFKEAALGWENIERRVRIACRDIFRSSKLLKRIIPDIKEVLFGNSDNGKSEDEPEGRDVAISH